MSSSYVIEMRNALQGYRDTKKKAEQRVNEIKELYGDEAAAKESERLDKQIKSARSAAERTINQAYDNGVYLAKEWSRPDGSKLTDDMKLFDAGLVTPEVYEELKNRYSSNSTMLSAIKAQGEKLNAAAAKADREKGGLGMTEPYNVRDIRTGDDRIKAWESIKKQAYNTLDMLDGTGAYSDTWGAILGKHLGDATIDTFGESYDL